MRAPPINYEAHVKLYVGTDGIEYRVYFQPHFDAWSVFGYTFWLIGVRRQKMTTWLMRLTK